MKWFLWIFFPAFAAYSQNVVDYAKGIQNNLRKSEVSTSGFIQSQTALFSVSAPSNPQLQQSFQGQVLLNYANIVSCPINFYITHSQFSYTYQLPFTRPQNQLGFSPEFKRFTLLAGYRSIYLSDYSLQGLPFLGGGAIYHHPEKKIKIVVASGQFLCDNKNDQPTSFKRLGVITHIKLGSEKKHLVAGVCKWKDVLKEGAFDEWTHMPSENLILSMGFAYGYKNWDFSLAYNKSIYTHNLLQPIERRPYFTYLNEYFDPRPSTRIYQHVAAKVTLHLKKASAEWEMQRTDDGYASMGAPWLLNDVLKGLQRWQYTKPEKELQLQSELAILKNNLRHLQRATLYQFSSWQQASWRWLPQLTQRLQQKTQVNQLDTAFFLQSFSESALAFNHATKYTLLTIEWQEQLQTNANQLQFTPTYNQHQISCSKQNKTKRWQWRVNYQLMQLRASQAQRVNHGLSCLFQKQSKNEKLVLSSTTAIAFYTSIHYLTQTWSLQYKLPNNQSASITGFLQKQFANNVPAFTYRFSFSYRWIFQVKKSLR